MSAADFRGVDRDLSVLTSAWLTKGRYLHPPRGFARTLRRVWRICTGRSADRSAYSVGTYFSRLANSAKLPGRYRNRALAILLHHRKEEILRRQLAVDEFTWTTSRR